VTVRQEGLLAGLIGFALLLLPGLVSAAPFCVVSATGTRCWYYTATACEDAAMAVGGACVVNTDEAGSRPSAGGAPFCVVTAVGQQCFYYQVDACEQAARALGGGCIVNPDR